MKGLGKPELKFEPKMLLFFIIKRQIKIKVTPKRQKKKLQLLLAFKNNCIITN